jgi:hypothetical protein
MDVPVDKVLAVLQKPPHRLAILPVAWAAGAIAALSFVPHAQLPPRTRGWAVIVGLLALAFSTVPQEALRWGARRYLRHLAPLEKSLLAEFYFGDVRTVLVDSMRTETWPFWHMGILVKEGFADSKDKTRRYNVFSIAPWTWSYLRRHHKTIFGDAAVTSVKRLGDKLVASVEVKHLSPAPIILQYDLDQKLVLTPVAHETAAPTPTAAFLLAINAINLHVINHRPELERMLAGLPPKVTGV